MQIRFYPSNLKFAALFFMFLMPCLVTAPVRTSSAQEIQGDDAARFQLADSYVRAGQFERAIPILEQLRTREPGSVVYYDRLKAAYEGLKHYDAAIALVQDMMLHQGETPTMVAELAALHYQKGDEEEAYRTWDRVVEISPEDRNSYRVVYFSLVQHRLFDRAIEILQSARTRFNDPTLFQIDIAFLYGVIGKHELAMQEYLSILNEDPRQINFVKSRLGRYTEQEEALAVFVEAAERAVRRDPLNRGYRELSAWLYAEKGDFRQALDANRAIDRLEDEQGRVLFAFAQNAANSGAYDVAADAYQEILRRYGNSQIAPNVQYSIGFMYERQAVDRNELPVDPHGDRHPAPLYEAALEAYENFIENNAGHSLVPEALRAHARVKQDVYFDFDAAEGILNRIVREYPGSDAARQARFDLARIAVQQGDLITARIMFARLEEELRTGDLAERARYQTALVDFYMGHFETALSRVRAMTENYASDVANNAIELRLVLQENVDDTLTTALQEYADALYLKRKRAFSDALGALEALAARYPQHALQDDIRYQKALIYRDTERFEEALATFAEIRARFRNSHLVDRSLFRSGEIYERHLQDASSAIAAYETILVEYPGSLFVAEARRRIRQLRGDGI